MVLHAALAVVSTLVARRAAADALRSTSEVEALNARLREANARLDERVTERTAQLDAELQRQREESRRDPLTGLFNRRELDQRLEDVVRRARGTGSSVCLAMLDLDRFKRVNDRHGHATGDAVLMAVGRLLLAHTREQDLVARYGGEEFVVVMPRTTLEEGQAVAERVRAAVNEHDWTTLADGLGVTVSIGLEVAAGRSATAEGLLAVADARLYAAKRAGRDRVAAEEVISLQVRRRERRR